METADKPFPFKINRKLCKRCGICISFCPTEVYTSEEDGGPKITNPDKCIDCKMCFLRCPDFAISRGEGQ